jgi:hypothetical protein
MLDEQTLPGICCCLRKERRSQSQTARRSATEKKTIKIYYD